MERYQLERVTGRDPLRAVTHDRSQKVHSPELVTDRAGRSFIITSNRTPEHWYPLFPNPVIAESVLDRIINTAHHIHLDGRSYRPIQRPKGATTD